MISITTISAIIGLILIALAIFIKARCVFSVLEFYEDDDKHVHEIFVEAGLLLIAISLLSKYVLTSGGI